ncbi:alkaline phosphatase family protein [Dinghuibacter silviterrae]|uniref:Putative AlkP superfamily pyrophosphatase or phosphodiesterase n=1 Tax=Dinghuibacter silviterrae TaxID=1539049 RepID=A0A4R8DTQ5_9BACT|nr:ectonucleotide pyrophosphatase/phosphodiesterase [Dinghuibacter silviterrae]TDX01509.1 putative AlkP superfamily pyrophosphatase or phosphodiesterase [Dinghuibacter silviterrae]
MQYRLVILALWGAALWGTALLGATALRAQDTAQYVVPGRSNDRAQEKKPYVILISADGFRADLADKYQATNLIRLRSSGVQAAYMESSFPSVTFPNHYTLVTGLYPSHHGLVDNRFYDHGRNAFYSMSNKKTVTDSSWYGGVPLWTLAEQQHLLSASFYWVGSEAAIGGLLPTYYYHYNTAIPIDARIQTVVDWLQLPEDKRPHLIAFYFPEVDHAEHLYGPDAWQVRSAVQFVDQSVGKMVDAVNGLDLAVNFIFVSDHGMTPVDTAHLIDPLTPADTAAFTVVTGATMIHMTSRTGDKKVIKATYARLKAAASGYDVYLADDVPSRWHYGKRDDRYDRIGDIILVPQPPHVFGRPGDHIHIGEHGFDPALPDMHATFYAWGPAFKPKQTIGAFENVNVYPLVARILGLPYTEKIDGKPGVLDGILR